MQPTSACSVACREMPAVPYVFPQVHMNRQPAKAEQSRAARLDGHRRDRDWRGACAAIPAAIVLERISYLEVELCV